MEPSRPAGRTATVLTPIASLGFAEEDDDGRRMEKTVLTFAAVFTAAVVTPWAVFYYAIGVPQAAAIPTAYVLATIAGLAHLRATRDDAWFRRSQLAMFLTLPPLVHVALGGFANSSGVILFAAAAPVGALSYSRVRRPLLVFAAFVAIVVAMVPLESTLEANAPRLDAWIVTLFFAVNIVSVSTIVFVAMRAYVRSRDRLAAALADERDRSDRILRNVLPGPIADRLIAGEHPIADRFDEVGVLIADIVDFTSLSETMSADELVHDLNELLGTFDALADRLGVTKVKTIGDAYLAITGGPAGEADLQALADFALGLRDLASAHAIGGRQTVQLRVGLDVGPVVAGVIGESRFLWDVYGETVNTASRMESTAPPGSIQLTDRIAGAVAERFVVRPRGIVEIKGMGPVHTSFLEARVRTS
ncbi:adenylate/guanylate cyclase domain-containing protein [Agromyces sp. ZXT2-6]|uniref:adenylate/guanylate cyclase domain-containing protein n=1 Tax=Agromyces sp. ZXT2-6 TaxID=3461153 RepID=UPI0040551D46